MPENRERLAPRTFLPKLPLRTQLVLMLKDSFHCKGKTKHILGSFSVSNIGSHSYLGYLDGQ